MLLFHCRSDKDRIRANTVFVVTQRGHSDMRSWFEFKRNRCCFKSEIIFEQFNCVKQDDQWACAREDGAMPYLCHIPGQNGHFDFVQ